MLFATTTVAAFGAGSGRLDDEVFGEMFLGLSVPLLAAPFAGLLAFVVAVLLFVAGFAPVAGFDDEVGREFGFAGGA